MNNLQLTKIKTAFSRYNLVSLFVVSFMLLVVVMPAVVGAASIIPCGGSGEADSPQNRPCTFEDLVTLGNNIINFLIKKVAAPFAVILFIWAGFLMMFKSSSSGSLDEAKSIFWNVVVGFVIAMAAMLIIKFVLSALGTKEDLYKGRLGFNVVELKK